MEQSPPPQSAVTNVEAGRVVGWTKEEKFCLLQALKGCGSSDFNKIQEFVPTKTCDEIKTAIDYFKEKALLHPIFREKLIHKQYKKKSKTRAPLSSWAKVLTDKYSYDQLCTETSTAVRLIGEFEAIPAPTRTENIDFRKVYLQIANALEGKPLAADNVTTTVFNKCLIETALSSKAFIKASTFKYVINSIDMSEEPQWRNLNLARAAHNQELLTLRHLIANKSYNPFGLSDTYLTHMHDKTD